MRRAPCLLFTALLAAACSPSPSAPRSTTDFPAPTYRAVLAQRLEEFRAEGLPTITVETVQEVEDLLSLSGQSGRLGNRARQRLAELDPAVLTSACLTLVETHNMALETRLAAYAWMREHAPISVLPRLTLRLKYEKDWPANVDIARTLLRHGSGAGLSALIHILEREDGDARIELARYQAMEALRELPQARAEESADFPRDWQRLLDLEREWQSHRPWLAPAETAPVLREAPRPLRAELWRMADRLRSQPLRPVDDARFVFVRMPQAVFPLLLELTQDQDRYVREHALQTIAWIGYPIGRWAQTRPVQVLRPLLELRGDPPLRPRLFAALGALGLAEAAPELLPWLREGNLEESTAAADALLRCADAAQTRALQAAQAELAPSLSPEGQYALALLLASLAGQELDSVPVPPELDRSEAERRLQWARARAERP